MMAMKLIILAALVAATTACTKNGDCQTGGDMSGYCKANNDCHCSAPHFTGADNTCQLACSPGDASNACCRDDADCKADGDANGYCKTLKGYNPGNGQCRCGAGFSGSTSCKKSPMAMQDSPVAAQKGFCSPCIQLTGQGINILLNEILNVGVVGGCSKLCSGLNSTKGAVTACNLLCDVVGIKAFAKALNHTDLDPIYFCEELNACPKGNPAAEASIVSVSAGPPTGPAGTKFALEIDFAVTNSTGVGEIRIGVEGPTTNPISQSFLNQGFVDGTFSSKVSLDTTEQDPSDPDDPSTGVVFNPGTYTYNFELCQGECGSKHPGSIVFGKKSGTFEITA